MDLKVLLVDAVCAVDGHCVTVCEVAMAFPDFVTADGSS